jgi:hypothetical protein
MNFYTLPKNIKHPQIARIMKESAETFTHANTARQYIALYERMLERPLILENASAKDACEPGFKPELSR